MTTRSLGQLTLDLVARTGSWTGPLDKASRSTERRMNDIKRSVGRAASAVTALGVASAATAAGGLYMLTQRGLEAVDAQAKLAARLDSTIGEVRGLELAAADAGVAQGALASSIESYNKRLGDAARGTGEAQKAYKALGLEASELANMPLPEQLALVADRISQLDNAAERASIADRLMSGGRRMTVLFQQGGDAIRDAVQEVEDYGLAIDAIDASVLEAANDALSRTGLVVESLRNSLAVELAPIILEIVDRFNEAAREAGGFGEMVEDAVENAALSVGVLLDSFQELRTLNQHVVVATADMELAFADFARNAWGSFGWLIDTAIAGVNNLIRGMNAIPGFTDLDLIESSFDGSEFMDGIDAQFEKALGNRNLAQLDLNNLIDSESPSAYVEQLFDDIEERRQQLASKGGIFKSLDHWLFEDPPSLGGDGGDGGGGSSATSETTHELERQADAYQRLLDQIYPVAAAQRQFREEMEQLAQADAAGAVDDLADAQERLRTQYSAELTGGFMEQLATGGIAEELENTQSLAEDLGLTFTSAFEDAVIGGKNFRDVLGGIADDLARLAVRKAVTEPAIDAIGGIDWGGLVGSFFGGGGGGSSGGVYGNVVGQAHDGIDRVPATGTWNLQKGERVVTAATSDKLDRTLDQVQHGSSANVEINVHTDGDAEVSRQESRRSDGTRQFDLYIERKVDQRMQQNFRDGSMTRLMADTYGLRRKPR